MQLLTPLEVGAITLRNRVVMAPMTRERAPGGVPTIDMAAYYARRAAGGAALIITEGAATDRCGSFGRNVPNFFGDDALAGWHAVAAAVHAQGAAILAQLWHVGAFTPSLVGMEDSVEVSSRRSPSGLAGPDRPMGQAMTQSEIDRSIDGFARASAAALRIGFDGVEIHGAHGYLPDQFLWSATNQRSDAYGGALEQRVRFAVELVQACRAALGTRGVLSFRLSQWKQLDYNARIAATPGELGTIVQALTRAGVDVFHCSTRRYWEPAFADSELPFAAWVKKLSGKPSIAVGSVTLGNDFKSTDGKQDAAVVPGQIDDIERRLVQGEFDLVALGRALLANADWVEMVRSGRLHDLRAFSKSHLDQLQ